MTQMSQMDQRRTGHPQIPRITQIGLGHRAEVLVGPK